MNISEIERELINWCPYTLICEYKKCIYNDMVAQLRKEFETVHVFDMLLHKVYPADRVDEILKLLERK